MVKPIDPRKLEIARDLLSRRAEGWSEERIAERRRMLLARLEAPVENPKGKKGTLPAAEEINPQQPFATEIGARRHTKPMPGSE